MEKDEPYLMAKSGSNSPEATMHSPGHPLHLEEELALGGGDCGLSILRNIQRAGVFKTSSRRCSIGVA